MNTTVNLTDKAKRNHIKLVLGEDGLWEKWESKDKVKWFKTSEQLTMENVFKEKEEIKNRNIKNLFSIIFKKK
jgi:hypothetical protein